MSMASELQVHVRDKTGLAVSFSLEGNSITAGNLRSRIDQDRSFLIDDLYGLDNDKKFKLIFTGEEIKDDSMEIPASAIVRFVSVKDFSK